MDTGLTIDDIDYLIKCIKDENEVNSFESYTYIKNIFQNLHIPLPTRLVPVGTRVARCRPHSNNEDFFKLISDLSYRTDLINIKKFGRANEPGQSMFYCSDAHELSFVETSLITRQNVAVDFELLTTGVWEVEKELIVVNILTNDRIKGRNKVVDAMHEDFENFIKQAGQSGEVLKRFLTFVSDEFTKEAKGDSSKYMISCAFANYVYNNFPNVDGILFPSSLYPDKGMNFVILPETVDKSMKFLQARRGKMKKRSGTVYDEVDTIESKMNKDEVEKIDWV